MEYYKISQGNSPTLHVILQKAIIGKSKQTLVDLDTATFSEIKLYLLPAWGGKITLDWSYADDALNEIKAVLPNNLLPGPYGVMVEGEYNGVPLSSRERHVLSIVPYNRKTHIPLGILEGELGGMLNAKYWLDINNEEQNIYTVKVTSDPATITYDGEQHTVTVSWAVKDQNGNDIVPDSLTIQYGEDVTTLDPSSTSMDFTVQSAGVHSFIVTATIGDETVNGIARTQVEENDVITYYGIMPYDNIEDIAENLQQLLDDGLLTQSDRLPKLLSPLSLTTTTAARHQVIASNKPFGVIVGGIDVTTSMSQGESVGVYFRWTTNAANRTTIFTLY